MSNMQIVIAFTPFKFELPHCQSSKSFNLCSPILLLNKNETFYFYFSQMKLHVFYKSSKFQFLLQRLEITINVQRDSAENSYLGKQNLLQNLKNSNIGVYHV